MRLNTYIDIPLEIALPHFVSDDRIDDDSAIFGNFKLVLQSAVCHRGVSVDSGHYVALVRGDVAHGNEEATEDGAPPEYRSNQWLLFDDLAPQRVVHVDINEALKKEAAYLLFYQVRPIDDREGQDSPPSYAEANASRTGSSISSEALSSRAIDASIAATPSHGSLPTIAPLPSSSPQATSVATRQSDASSTTVSDVQDYAPRAASMDLPSLTARVPEFQGRSSMSSARNSIAVDDASSRGRTAPTTPANEEGRFNFLTPSSRRGSKVEKIKTKSRPSSQSGDRLAAAVGVLTGRKSRDRLADKDEVAVEEGDENANSSNVVLSAASKFGNLGRSKSKKKRESRLKMDGNTEATGEQPDRECVVM